MTREDAVEKFFANVVKDGPDRPDVGGRCWLYRAGVNLTRYGSVSVGDGRTAMAHRLQWETTNGPIPPGMHVCHRCDTPACVNPEHLFLGTPRENAQDKVAKGRMRVHAGPRPEPVTVSVCVMLTDTQCGVVDAKRNTIPRGMYIREAAMRHITGGDASPRAPGIEVINGRDLNIAAAQLAAARMARGEHALSAEDIRRVFIGLFGHPFDRFENVRVIEGRVVYGQFTPGRAPIPLELRK